MTSTPWDYEQIVDHYDQKDYLKIKEFRARSLLELCKPNSKILDVGCAAGGLYRLLKESFPQIKYVGVDITREMIKRAKSNYPDVDFHLEDVTNLKFEDNSFDIVVCWDVIIHILEYKKAVKELYRVCRHTLSLGNVMRGGRQKTIVNVEESYQVTDEGINVYLNVFNKKEFINFLVKELTPKPTSITVEGTWGYLGQSVHVPFKNRWRLTALLVIKKGTEDTKYTEIRSNIPNETMTLVKARILKHPVVRYLARVSHPKIKMWGRKTLWRWLTSGTR